MGLQYDWQQRRWDEATGQEVPFTPGSGTTSIYDPFYLRKDISSPQQFVNGPVNFAANGFSVGTNQVVTSGGMTGFGRTPTAYRVEVQGDIYATGTIRGDGSGLSNIGAGNFATVTANRVLAGATTGAAATPTFRSLVAADIPALNYEPPITAGTAAQYWKGTKVWATLDTLAVPENANLYFTNARADVRADVRIAAAVGVTIQGYDATLTALAAFNTNGLIAQTTTDTFAGRTLTGPAAGIGVTNGNGVAGNPTLSLANDLAALEGLTGTGFAARTATDTWTQRTLTSGSGISITSGDGVAGNPTVANTGVLSVSGTTNQVSVSAATGAVTFSLPQNVHTGATPTFAGATFTGDIALTGSPANLRMFDASTGWRASSTLVVTPQNNNTIRSTSFTTGLVGWTLDPNYAEFNNIRVRGEIAASVFKVSEISATAGTFGVFNSASTVASPALTASVIGGVFGFIAKNSDAGGMLFGVGDIVRFKSWTGAGISDAWATITARTNNGTTTTYTATLSAGSTSATYSMGASVVDYGPAGTGFITLSADGTVGASPNLTMGTHAGSPWSSQTTLLRMGNLNGAYNYASDTYGFGVGQYGVANTPWLTVDTTNGIRIGGGAGGTTVLGQWDTSGNLAIGRTGAGFGNTYITSAGVLQLRVGTTVYSQFNTDGSGWLANSSVSWTAGGAFFILGSATIGGWAVGATTITSTGIALRSGGSANIAFGSIPPTGATTGTGVFVDATGFYGLASNVQQVKVSATDGKLTAGGGGVILDANGLTVAATNGSGGLNVPTTFKWVNSSVIVAEMFGYKASASNSELNVYCVAGTSTGNANAYFWTQNSTGTQFSQFRLATATGPNNYAVFFSTTGTYNGLRIGSDGIPAAMLDVRGAASITSSLTVDTNTFYVDATNHRVGIGTTAPDWPLHIKGTGSASVVGQVENTNIAGNATWFAKNDVGNLVQFGLYGSAHAAYGAITSGNGYMYCSTGMTIMSDGGTVVIASGGSAAQATFSTTGGLRLHAYGAGTLSTDINGNVTASSDRRLKDVIAHFTRGMEAVRKLQPVYYFWNRQSGFDRTTRYVGYVAQDVMTPLPEAVGPTPDSDYLTLDTRVIMAAHTNAIKELDGSLTSTFDRLDSLEAQILTLRRRLEALGGARTSARP